jgi:energy-coupling factor transporter ATP-binding protein EcfA2
MNFRPAVLDYHLGRPDTTRLVVEAKRAGKTFSLAISRPRTVSLQQLRDNHGKDLRAAINQAQDYARRVGTLPFAVTNGHQWIISQLIVPGLPESSIQAIVFYSLEDIEQNLQEFVDLLSPSGMAAQTIAARAGATASRPPAFAKSLNQVLFSSAPYTTNYLIAPLRLLMRECFGDLTGPDQSNMLSDCYVSTDTTSQHARLLETFAGNNLPTNLPLGTSKVKRDSQSTRDLADQISVGTSILIVGKAGSGKSTFLAMVRQRIGAVAGQDHLLVYVDLLTRTETHAESFDHDKLIDDVCGDILIEIQQRYPSRDPFSRETLEDIFSGEIDRLRSRQRETNRTGDAFDAKVDEVIEKHVSQPRPHLRSFLGFLGKRGVPVTILLDNVDRGTTEFEMVTTKLADQLATNTKATVVTCLRDTTYQRGRIGFLDVRRQTVMTISPPPFVEVAKKRFDAARKRLASDQKFRRRLSACLSGTPIERVTDFAEIMSELLMSDQGALGECISCLAGTNIRTALRLLEDFAVSPHTDLNRLFKSYQNASKGHFSAGPPIDVFLRSVMRGDAQRYSENNSHIINLFQAPNQRVGSHFTAIRVLQFLDWCSGRAHIAVDSTVNEVVSRLGAIGHSPSDVMDMLNHLGRHGLVLSLSRAEPNWQREDVIRIGVAGKFYLERMLDNREYINNILDDTTIYEERVLTGLQLVQDDRLISHRERLDKKALQFLGYLARREPQEVPAQRGASSPVWLNKVSERIGIRRFGATTFGGTGTTKAKS